MMYNVLAFGQIKVWDSEERKCLQVLTGHTGSVKSISAHPSNSGMIMVLSVILIYEE